MDKTDRWEYIKSRGREESMLEEEKGKEEEGEEKEEEESTNLHEGRKLIPMLKYLREEDV